MWCREVCLSSGAGSAVPAEAMTVPAPVSALGQRTGCWQACCSQASAGIPTACPSHSGLLQHVWREIPARSSTACHSEGGRSAAERSTLKHMPRSLARQLRLHCMHGLAVMTVQAAQERCAQARLQAGWSLTACRSTAAASAVTVPPAQHLPSMPWPSDSPHSAAACGPAAWPPRHQMPKKERTCRTL